MPRGLKVPCPLIIKMILSSTYRKYLKWKLFILQKYHRNCPITCTLRGIWPILCRSPKTINTRRSRKGSWVDIFDLAPIWTYKRRYEGGIWLIFLIIHPCLIGLWFNEDQRTNTMNTHSKKRLDYLQDASTTPHFILNIIGNTYVFH